MTLSSEIPLNDFRNDHLCVHTLLADGVHEFVFQESSRAAVNAWIDQLVAVLDTTCQESVLPLVVDTRLAGMLPLAYVIQRLRDVYLDHSRRPSMRLAFLSGNSALMVFVQLLAEIAAANEAKKVEYHQSVTEAEALEWLLTTQ